MDAKDDVEFTKNNYANGISRVDREDGLVKEILTARYWALDDDDRLLLNLASQVGELFWIELLGTLLGKSCDNNCSSLVRRGFFKESFPSYLENQKQLSFTDLSFVDWVKNQSQNEDNTKLHQQVADWIIKHQEFLPTGLFPFLTYHLGKSGNVQKAISFWLEQANLAYEHCETLTALQYLTQAIELARKDKEIADLLADCLLKRADLLRRLGRLEAALADYEMVQKMEVSLEFNQRAMIGKGEIDHKRGNQRQALELFRRALDLAGVYFPSGRVRAWRKIASVYMSLGQNSQAKTALIRCHEVLAALKTDREVLVETIKYYGTHGLLLYSQGRLLDSLTEFEKGADLVKQNNIPALDSLILCSVYLVYSSKGELGKALELCRKAVELTDIAGILGGLVINLINLSGIYCSLGQYGRALMEVKRALELGQTLDDKLEMAHATYNRAIIHHDSGDEKTAEADITVAIGLYQNLDDRYHTTTAQLNLIRWYLDWGRLEEAVSLFERLPILGRDEDILLFGYHLTMGNILLRKAQKEEDRQAKEAILDTARSSFYRARWRASEQKSFTELLSVHISLIALEVTWGSEANARRHITIVEAMFKIMLDSLPDPKMKKSLNSTWSYKELQRLMGLAEKLTKEKKV